MPKIETLTTQEVECFVNCFTEYHYSEIKRIKGIRNRTIALLMLDAGLRVGEVVKLLVTDLWFNFAPVTSIYVSAQISKNNSARTVPVSERLNSSIRQMNESFWNQNFMQLCPWAFPSAKKTLHITVRQVERIIGTAGKKAINREVNPHMLRHTFATRVMRTTNIRVVQELLGHKALTSTQVYTHPNSEDLKKAIESI